MKNMGRTTALSAALAAAAMIATTAVAGPALALSRPADPHKHAGRTHRLPGSSQTAAGPSTFTTATACASGQTYTVPDGVFALHVQAVGGHGAAGAETTSNGGQNWGGLGGLVTTTIPVRPGQELRVQVGGNGNRAGNGGAGGIGGGGNGGSSKTESNGEAGASGGGGGFSGIASADCNTWYAIAGGGGGGGAGVTKLRSKTDHMGGGHGGDACSLTGANCRTASDGSSRTPWAGIGHAGSSAPAAGGGGGGNPGAGPTGHTGGGGGAAPTGTDDSVGGGGGGGGGYWAGGGGGSGYRGGGPGGGGAGGTSWTIGFPGTTVGNAADGQAASVTITPASDVVIQSADNGQVLNIDNGNTDDGTRIIQWPRVNDVWNETWNLVPFDGPAYQIQNPKTGKCLTIGGPDVSTYAGVELSTCTGIKAQVWQVDWEPDGTARIYNPAGDLSIAGSADGVPVDVAPQVTDPSHRWSITATGWPSGS